MNFTHRVSGLCCVKLPHNLSCIRNTRWRHDGLYLTFHISYIATLTGCKAQGISSSFPAIIVLPHEDRSIFAVIIKRQFSLHGFYKTLFFLFSSYIWSSHSFPWVIYMIYEPGDSLGQGINHKAIERLTRVDTTACNLLKSDICMPNAGTKIQCKNGHKWSHPSPSAGNKLLRLSVTKCFMLLRKDMVHDLQILRGPA